jgi:hypothetical protein
MSAAAPSAASVVTKPKGFIPKKCLAATLAPPEILNRLKDSVSTSTLEAVSQPYGGTPPTTSVITREKPRENPVIIPKTTYSAPLSKAVTESLPAAPITRSKPLKYATNHTPDYTPRERKISEDDQKKIDEGLPVEFKEYQLAQTKIESTNPYLTDTVIYTPQTRKSFYTFIKGNYSSNFELPRQIIGHIDQDACAKLGAAAGTAVEAFLYQKFVREYIRNASPYRGILVYHGLGSGKTCSAIAAAEALYGTANKKIIVMTPASLRGNFMSEISFCGFRHFNTQNHWISQPIVAEDKKETYASATAEIAILYAKSILSLSEQFIAAIQRRPEAERKVIWIPDFTKPPNYDSLSQQEREDIRAQITNMIESRVTFINYNGIPASELKRYACEENAITGERRFDNAVIVIDEVHNLTRLMQGEILPYIVKRKGRARKIPVEPIVPGKWKPGLCDATMNYKRAYLFYKLLTDARNSKIIALSGTPIINFPEEVGILANILGGYIECAKVSLMSSDKAVMEKFKKIAEADPRVDIVRFRAGDRKMDVLISVFNEGYERVLEKEGETSNFVGVRYNPDAQDGIRTVFERIKTRLAEESIPIGTEEYVSYPRLPIDDETFRKEFINPADLSIKNELVLQKRLTGLISYYKGSKVEYMPRVAKDEIVKCEMSDYVLSKYTVERKREITGESKKDKEKGDAFADVEVYAKMKNPSSYRFRSRALCNFAFPKTIDRPFPDSGIEEEEETTLVEDLEMSEAQSDVFEDLAAEEAVARENDSIEDPEEESEGEAEAEREGKKENENNSSSVASSLPSLPNSESSLESSIESNNSNASSVSSSLPSISDVDSNIESNESEGEEDKEQAEALARFKAIMAAKKKGGSQEGGEGTDDESEKPTATATATAPVPPRRVIRRPRISVPAPSSGVAESKDEGILDTLASAASLAADTVADTVTAAASTVTSAAATAVSATADTIRSTTGRRRPVISTKLALAPEKEESVAEAEYEAEQEAVATRTLTYQERIQRAMDKLDAQRDSFLKLDSHIPEARLAEYSTKLDHMLRRILSSKGSNLVYSQFKTVEGLGVLGITLKANGFVEIRIDGGDAAPYFSEETEESLRKGPSSGQKRFISFTGEGSRERRNLILNVFNGNFDKLPTSMRTVLEESGFTERKNMYGELCWVIGITGAGAEGISLKCCRSVHIMEPYWNNVRLDQVKGRAIRICSHQDLPFKERDVEIYTYYTVFSTDQKNRDKIDMTIRTTDENETSDEKVFNVSIKKDKVNQGLLELMKETAVDCGLNVSDNGLISCLAIEGRPDQYLFDPDLEVDKILTNIELKRVERVKEDIKAPEASIMKEVSAKAKPKVDIIQSLVIRIRGVEYYTIDKPGSGGMIKSLFAMSDKDFKTPLGEIPINPADGTLKGSKPTFYYSVAPSVTATATATK